MLCTLIWLPVFAAILLILSPIKATSFARIFSTATALLVLALSLWVFGHTTSLTSGYLYEIQVPWVTSLGISYHLGVNAFGGLLILLTSLVGTASILVSKPTSYPNHFFAMLLIMMGGMMGAFASLDLIFFFIFHEFALIPTFILIGIWGGEQRRRAAMKITLYLGLGSLVLLFGILALYGASGAHTFDLPTLKAHLSQSPLPGITQVWLFLLLFLGFGILISVFPFHTWAPSGYAEAPTAAAMLHAGVIKKFGLFGLFTVAIPLLPHGFSLLKPLIFWMALGNLLYCGYVTLHQKNLRYLLAYSSVSHMGYAFLALMACSTSPIAATGFTLFLFAHGLSAAAAFASGGACCESTGTSEISRLGGLAKQTPFLATSFAMAAFAGSGLPGFANFPAELMIFTGSSSHHPFLTLAAVWTVVLSAVYFLRAIRHIFFGPLPENLNSVPDAGYGTRIALFLLLFTLLWAGFNPSYFTPKSFTQSSPSALVLK